MIAMSEGDAWMGLKSPRVENASIRITWYLEEEGEVRVERWDVRGKAVRTTKSRLLNISPICSKRNK